MSILVPFTLTLGVAWVLWQLLKAYLLKSPLDNLPGPDRTSFLQGAHEIPTLTTYSVTDKPAIFRIGNLGDLYGRCRWDFQDDFSTKFPAVAKYHAALGVSALNSSVSTIIVIGSDMRIAL